MDSWTELMRRGDFAAAWRVSDEVLRARTGQSCWHLPRHQQYIWNGDSLAGKRVLVRCYHGLGDTIQFVRYAPLLRAIAAEVILWVQPALVGILRGMAGVDRILPLHDGTPDASYDADVEIMELAHVFRSTLATLPAWVPYLTVPVAPPQERGRGPAGVHVGLVWQAGDWDGRRSVPLPLLATLACIPGVHLHALQRGAGLAEWRDEYGPVTGSDGVAETARVMQTLDLIISVDSFPAHLAGALACPVWTLLHSEPDWRWLTGREDSPWYPTMRLYRQPQAGDWETVVARLRDDVRELVNSGLR